MYRGSWFTYFLFSFHWIKYYDCNPLFCSFLSAFCTQFFFIFFSLYFKPRNAQGAYIYSFSIYFILCYFGGLYALHLVWCLVSICISLCSSAQFCLYFSLVLASTNVLLFSTIQFLSAFCVYIFFKSTNIVHRTLFLIFMLLLFVRYKYG